MPTRGMSACGLVDGASEGCRCGLQTTEHGNSNGQGAHTRLPRVLVLRVCDRCSFAAAPPPSRRLRRLVGSFDKWGACRWPRSTRCGHEQDRQDRRDELK